MADQPNIFGNQSQETPGQPAGSNPANVQIDPAITTMLAGIRNEQGEQKYKTLDEALKALKHSQEYIPQITAQLRDKDNEIQTLKGTVGKVEEIEKTVLALTQHRTEELTRSNPGLTAEQVADLVNQTLTLKQQQSLAEQNTQTVVASLQAVYGTEAEKVFYAKGAELGMTPAEINALAAKSPKAVLNLIGVQTKATTAAPVHSSINPGGFAPKQDSKIGRNDKGVPVGATSHELASEWQNAKQMVVELEENGMSIDDMTNPKNYFKYFGKKDK